ncbi:MAG TPA: transketolase family protein [Terriglobales bacterium]|nr:transketolase family protein [Terriglobales bacterium]
MSERFDCRDSFATTLEAQADRDPRVVAVVNDSVGSSKLVNFRKRFPNRFVNVGIAEQNMVGIGAGLANGGKLPFVCGASCFLTARALEQIKVDLGYSNHNVRLCGMSSGVAYGELGPTHHSIEDLAWTRVIPNLSVIVPADPIETRAVVEYSMKHVGPMFIRISRLPVRNIHSENYTFQLGKAVRLRDGKDITLIAGGVMVSRALDAAEQLASKGISARVLNMSSAKPLDCDAVGEASRDTKAILTVEEHSIYGGLGSAVAEVVAQTRPIKMRILGFPGTFAPTGSAEWLLDHFRLNADGISAAAVELLESVKNNA